MLNENEIYESPQMIDGGAGSSIDAKGAPVLVMAVVAAGFYLVVGVSAVGGGLYNAVVAANTTYVG